MARYSDILVDSKGRPVAGCFVTVSVSSSGALASLTYDDGSAEGNPLVTDDDGSYYFNVSGDTYNLKYNYGGRTILERNNVAIGVASIGPVTYSAVTTALGFVPYDAANPQSYVSASGAQAAITVGGGLVKSGGQISATLASLSAVLGGNPVVTTGGTVTGPLLLTYAMTDPSAAASVGYVQSTAAGQLPKDNTVAATTANIALSGTQTIDGVAVTAGQLVLVKNQTTPSQNGIYVVSSGSWTRSTQMDTWAEVPGATTTVLGGTVNSNTTFTCNSTAGGTINSTAINFVTTNKPGSISGTGAVKTVGPVISLTPATQGTVLGTTVGGGTVAPTALTIPAVLGFSPANAAGQDFTGLVGVSGVAGTSRFFKSLTSGSSRWMWGAGGETESGSNAGSNWSLQRYSDTGTYIDTPLYITRNDGRGQWAQQFHAGTSGALDAIFPSVEQFSQILGASRTGTYGVVGFSDSRDLPLAGAMSNIGAAGFCYNGNSTQVQFGYGGYFEARRAAGAGATEGAEINILNGGSTVDITPGDPFASGGAVSAGLVVSSGRLDASGFNNPASAALLISSNGAKYRRCIVIDALAADSAGPVEALSVGVEYRLAWYLGSTRKAFIAGVDRSGVGTLNLGNLPVFTGNTAAVAAGFLAGDVYRTSTGQLMVAF